MKVTSTILNKDILTFVTQSEICNEHDLYRYYSQLKAPKTMLSFAWDDEKTKINLEKHGITFAKAKDFFYDEHARLIADEDNSEDEERFLLLGRRFKQ